MLGDPAAGGQLLEQRLVEPPWRAVVDIFDRGLAVTQPSGTQPGLEAPGVAIGGLAVEQQRQPFGVRETAGLLLGLEFDESLRHAVDVERSELLHGRDLQCGGFVARYMGDGILAYFGYPQAHEEDTER